MTDKYTGVARRVGRSLADWLEEIPGINSIGGGIFYIVVMLSVAALLIVNWLTKGPNSLSYALALACWTYGLGLAVAGPTLRIIPPHWFNVPKGERVLHRMLGVGIFDWVLEHIGYNRHVSGPMRGFNGTKAGLFALEQSVRANASAKVTCFGIHLLLAAVALFTGHPWSVGLLVLLPGVVIHLYPLLLQRSILLRLQPILDKAGS